MLKLKNNRFRLKLFVYSLTFIALISCRTNAPVVERVEGRKIAIAPEIVSDSKIEALITPYRDKVDHDMNTVLAYAPETLDKSGTWQTPIGNMFADATLQYSDKVYVKRSGKHLDLVMLNAGGVRTIIPKGDITTRLAYEIMPFENSVVAVDMTGTQLLELVQYIITEKKPHPIAGLSFAIDKNNQPQHILVAGKPLVPAQVYHVATNDYLYNGGDNMLFFKKSGPKTDLDYKLRNVLIDYFTDTDTIRAAKDIRISNME